MIRLFNWLTGRSARRRAQWLYRRGMVRAKLHRSQSAIDDYTAVIEMDDAPASTRSMALYNRALVQYAIGDETGAIDDLNAVLQMGAAGANIKTEARRKLVRMQRASERADTV